MTGGRKVVELLESGAAAHGQGLGGKRRRNDGNARHAVSRSHAERSRPMSAAGTPAIKKWGSLAVRASCMAISKYRTHLKGARYGLAFRGALDACSGRYLTESGHRRERE